MPKVYLSDTEKNPSEAEVDGVTLIRGDEQNPTDLKQEQIKRLEDIGVKLERASGGDS